MSTHSLEREREMSVYTNNDIAFNILWSPLPFISWFVPFIGHLGIADSRGIASDFQGPYYVGDDGRMAFGNPTRALKMDISDLPGGSSKWDEYITVANEIYRGRMHNLCFDNCHSHVAYALNEMGLVNFGIRKWDMVKLCFLVFFKARFLSFGGFLKQFLPFIFFLSIIIIFKLLRK